MDALLWKSETSTTYLRVPLSLVQSANSRDPYTGSIVGATVLGNKADGTGFATGVLTAVASRPGRYYVQLALADVDQLGHLTLQVTVAGANVEFLNCAVVDYNWKADGSSSTAVADALLTRFYRGGSNASPTLADLLAPGLCSFAIAGNVLTVKHSDGSTAFTRTLTRDSTLLLGAILSGA